MKKGDTVKIIILDIDKSNRRISLGHKQIYDDPWSTLEEKFAVGMITEGTIVRTLDRGVVVALENDIEGFVPTFQLGQDIKKPSEAFDVGNILPLKVIEFDKDQRKIVLSVREYFKDKDKKEFDEFREKFKPKPVTIGDAFGDILEGSPVQSFEGKDEIPSPPSEVSGEEKKTAVSSAVGETIKSKKTKKIEDAPEEKTGPEKEEAEPLAAESEPSPDSGGDAQGGNPGEDKK
jgi:small subunit ribosomal protein S1